MFTRAQNLTVYRNLNHSENVCFDHVQKIRGYNKERDSTIEYDTLPSLYYTLLGKIYLAATLRHKRILEWKPSYTVNQVCGWAKFWRHNHITCPHPAGQCSHDQMWTTALASNSNFVSVLEDAGLTYHSLWRTCIVLFLRFIRHHKVCCLLDWST